MRTKRSKRWDNGVKARLLAQLCYHDQDLKFEYACMGLEWMLKTYTQRELKTRLKSLAPQSLDLTTSTWQQIADRIDREILMKLAIPEEML